jgi:co-chaperonin GroES (HSP10)
MSNLILPTHVAEKLKKTASEPTPNTPKEDKGQIANAYVAAEELFLDPEKLPKSALDRLPQPVGWRLLVLPYRGAGKTKGGVLLADEFVERQTLATVVAYVLAVGPDAYSDKEKFPAGPWCQKGQWVMIGRYAGARFRIEGGEVRIINDDEVIGTIANPADVMNV